ncbi:hypothetical protein F5Y12DRAFT_363242 [Xylaria sp. FL1777]|nr:hypothetical protein F5Y12DRAFT_363242 [Xylaria sp. FL1777]
MAMGTKYTAWSEEVHQDIMMAMFEAIQPHAGQLAQVVSLPLLPALQLQLRLTTPHNTSLLIAYLLNTPIEHYFVTPLHISWSEDNYSHTLQLCFHHNWFASPTLLLARLLLW